MARLERIASVHSPTRSRVKISCSVRSLVEDIDSCYAVISLASGGYVHDRDTVTTEIRPYSTDVVEFRNELVVDYLFEEKQFVNVALYRCQDSSTHGTLMGTVESTIGRVIHGGGTISQPITPSGEVMENPPEVTIKVEEYLGSKESIILRIQGHNLDKKDLFGKSDPYICIERKSERGKKYRAYRTEVVKNTLNPEWRALKVSVDRLCHGDLDTQVCFRCFDWDGANGDPEDKDTEFDELIGEFVTSARDILADENEEKTFELINPRKRRKKKGYVNSGTITLRCNHTGSDYSFLDYMFGGTEMNFFVAIDLTASNGDVHQPSSLHYIDNLDNNEYGIAIQAVLEILHDYDSDQLFPAFGFGARVPPEFKICHEYPLTGDNTNVFCQGVNGVMEAYRRTLREVKLSGPTYFAPVIRYCIDFAKNYQDGSHYCVLLILTDGSIDDWNETKKAVIETSFLPVSIIVIGIGGGKFAEMEVLDQDFGLLKCGDQQALRDNVQFVQLRKYMRPAADGSDSVRWSKVALAKDVLNELPDQVLDFMRYRGLSPLNMPPDPVEATLNSNLQSANGNTNS